MTPVRRVAAWLTLLLVGGACLAGYAAILITSADPEVHVQAALLAGLGATCLIAGALIAVARHFRRPAQRFPPLFFGVVLFLAAVTVGGIAARGERWPALDPLFALLVVVATWLIVAAIAVRWANGRAVSRRVAFGTTVWGMLAAPAIAVLIELICAGSVFAAAVAGQYYADPEILSNIADNGIEAVISGSEMELLQTWTVVLGIVAVYALFAPLAEELAKLLGAMIFLARSGATRFDSFASGLFSGLGFASVETLFYALAAGEQWLLLVIIRAPVAVIHIVSAVAAAMGWYSGGKSIVSGYGLAVLIHGAWNGLTVSLLVITASIADPEQVPMQAGLALFGAVGGLMFLLLGCSAWFVNAARRFGRETWHTEPSEQSGRNVGQQQSEQCGSAPGTALRVV
ncbi:MAG: hypothetical protein DCC58_02545 [Chloroflexi bacterium]|nr:MAG: hypothetical protein DCC58_02545 [Chloroflexota bacterium]